MAGGGPTPAGYAAINMVRLVPVRPTNSGFPKLLSGIL